MINIYLIMHYDSIDIVPTTIKYLRKFTYFEKIFIVTNLSKVNIHLSFSDVEWIDESTVGVDFYKIKDWFINNRYPFKRAGWYFQQFLKLEIAKNIEGINYVVWDGDTIPLREIKFIEFIDNQEFFYYRPTNEYHYPYFSVIQKLIGLNKINNNSFISEYAVINREICLDLIDKIKKINVKQDWYINVLDNIDENEVTRSGFSEYEIIGNYQMFKKIKYLCIEGKSLRNASDYFGYTPTDAILENLSKDFLFASFERWTEPNQLKTLLFGNYPILFHYYLNVRNALNSMKNLF